MSAWWHRAPRAARLDPWRYRARGPDAWAAATFRPRSHRPAEPGILAPPDAVTVVPDVVMPPKPAPNPRRSPPLVARPAAATAPLAIRRAPLAHGWWDLRLRLGRRAGLAGAGRHGPGTRGGRARDRSTGRRLGDRSNAILAPSAIPGVVGTPIATAISSFSGRYEIPGLMPRLVLRGDDHGWHLGAARGEDRYHRGRPVEGPELRAPQQGCSGYQGGPAGGRLELVFPLVSRGGNADIYGVR